ncbi:MAG: hypothetical protein AMJ43_06310 [Coxiella sp. DG_40]|nr:MAG: hypothetical protein AMJ43_06310 [Coxiella sp. DG_40]
MPVGINSIQIPQETLSVRAVKSGLWVFLLRIIQLLFQTVKLIILAHLLDPYNFGLMGVALLTMAILETFSATGFQTALIQKKEDIKSYLDIAWTVLVLRGFVLFVLLYLIAPYAAIFFNEPKAAPVIQAVGISVIFKALTNIGIIYFRKDLQFSKEFFYQLIGTLIDFIVVVSVALTLRNVWALVFGFLAGNFARFIVSYLIHPYRPHIALDCEKLKELFGFGKWVLGSSVLLFFVIHGDDAFVGKFLGVTMLGFYQVAYKISNMPATEITHIISQVTFPAYSKRQDNIPKLREAYLKVLQVTAFLSLPTAGLIFVLAPDFTKIFLGEKWMPMVPAMQVLALWGGIRSIGATTGPVFQATGKPEILTKLQLIVLVLLVIFIYPLSIHWGIFGTSLAVVLSTSLPNIVAAYLVINTLQCRIKDFCKELFLPLANTIVVIMFIFILRSHWVTEVKILNFLLTVILSILVYLGISFLFHKFFRYHQTLFDLVIKKIKKY